ncbi:MAG: alpha-ketoglutarate-dependent dioxygenase AlkB [Polyangia bacterium]
MRQVPLFPRPASPAGPSVPGLLVRPEYVSQDEERALVAHIEQGPWQPDFKRRIQQYGLGYGARPESGTDPGPASDEDPSPEISWVRDFPPWLAALAQRITADAFLPRVPENCVINDYAPGVGIGPHRDYPPFGSVIAAVSLLSDVVIDFARLPRGHDSDDDSDGGDSDSGGSGRIPVYVPARSLWVASGEARWRWTHGIAPRLSDRVEGERRRRGRRLSLTFRIARDPTLLDRARRIAGIGSAAAGLGPTP